MPFPKPEEWLPELDELLLRRRRNIRNISASRRSRMVVPLCELACREDLWLRRGGEDEATEDATDESSWEVSEDADPLSSSLPPCAARPFKSTRAFERL